MGSVNLPSSCNERGVRCQELYSSVLAEHLRESLVYRDRQGSYLLGSTQMMAEEPIILDATTVGLIEYHAQLLYSAIGKIPTALFGGELKRLAEFFVIPELLGADLTRYIDLKRTPSVGRPDLLFTQSGFCFVEQNLFCAIGSYQRADAAAAYFDAHPVTQAVRELYPLKRLSFFDSFASSFPMSGPTSAIYILDVAGNSDERVDSCGVALATALTRKGISVRWRILPVTDHVSPFADGGFLLSLYSPQIMARRIDVFGPIFDAARQADIEILGDLTDLLFWDKQLLAILSDPILGDFVTAEERASLDLTLPWTRLLRPHKTLYRGDSVSVIDHAIANKDKFVVKKGASTRGEATHIGLYYPQSSWEAIVGRAAKEACWIVQERVDSPLRKTCTLASGGVEYFNSVPICSPYMLRGKLVDFLVLHYGDDDHSRDVSIDESNRGEFQRPSPGVSAVLVAE